MGRPQNLHLQRQSSKQVSVEIQECAAELLVRVTREVNTLVGLSWELLYCLFDTTMAWSGLD